MMGSTEDPKDGAAVAAAVFGAVAVYAVSLPTPLLSLSMRTIRAELTPIPGIPHLLREPGLPTHSRKQARRNNTIIMVTLII
jgi:hypothetical protein